VELRQSLAARFGVSLPPTAIFDYPTVGALSRFIAEATAPAMSRSPASSGVIKSGRGTASGASSDGAGVGAIEVASSACDYPRGVSSPGQLWSGFTAGTEFQEIIPLERFDPELCGGGARTATFVADVDGFDAGVFRVSDAEALAMDPQQRKLLELCLRNYVATGGDTLADAVSSKTGVYLGVMWTEFQHLLVALGATQNGYTATGNGLSFLVGRPSFVFGLVGPSAVVDTACSSSLVATHLACTALSRGEATSAHAAGVQCMLLSETFGILTNLNSLSPDGRCKTLDASADGYGRGEGFAALYLRPPSAASTDGSSNGGGGVALRILGAAVNQDGRSSTFTAPYGPSQQALMVQALGEASTSPSEVRFLSTHGTGTSLGDPIELAAAGRALSSGAKVLNATDGGDGASLTVIGASKSFLGHTEGTAGMSGLLMAAAAAGQLAAPALRHCRNLNPHVAAGLAGLVTNGGAVFAVGPHRHCSPPHRYAL
jgi:acyl transferase domain-containing protein